MLKSGYTQKELLEEIDRLKNNEEKLVTTSNEQAKEIHKLRKEIKSTNELMDTLREIIDTQKKLIDIYENGTEPDNRVITAEQYRTRQQRIFQNKVNHGFNLTNIYQEARYILEEVAELMRAIEKDDRENMVEELSDIVIFAYGCAAVARLGDLDKKIFEKMELNEKREYTQNSEGDFVKTGQCQFDE